MAISARARVGARRMGPSCSGTQRPQGSWPQGSLPPPCAYGGGASRKIHDPYAVPRKRLVVHRISRGKVLASLVAATSLSLVAAPLTVPAQAAPTPVVDPALARSPELSETTRLPDRRTVVTGDRAWALGTADGYYPAAGFHTRGEMGGFWLPNLKLLDGMWFGINDDWIGPATKTTTGWGYVRADLPVTDGVAASRTDVVPDGISGVLVGLSLRSDTDQDHHLASGRPFGTAGLLSVGRDDSQPDRRQSARLRGSARKAPGLSRPRHSTGLQRRGAQLGRGVRHRPDPDRL